MEKFKGTKGPWQVVDTYHEYKEGEPQIIIWDGDEMAHGPICDMGEMGDMNYSEALANAKLIASAPELLKAALDFVKKVDDGKAKSTESYGKFKQAINKALG